MAIRETQIPTAGEIREALRDIGLALNACHNTVATDSPDAEPDEHGWRIDNGREIEQVRALERALLPNTGSARE